MCLTCLEEGVGFWWSLRSDMRIWVREVRRVVLVFLIGCGQGSDGGVGRQGVV